MLRSGASNRLFDACTRFAARRNKLKEENKQNTPLEPDAREDKDIAKGRSRSVYLWSERLIFRQMRSDLK